MITKYYINRYTNLAREKFGDRIFDDKSMLGAAHLGLSSCEINFDDFNDKKFEIYKEHIASFEVQNIAKLGTIINLKKYHASFESDKSGTKYNLFIYSVHYPESEYTIEYL